METESQHQTEHTSKNTTIKTTSHKANIGKKRDKRGESRSLPRDRSLTRRVTSTDNGSRERREKSASVEIINHAELESNSRITDRRGREDFREDAWGRREGRGWSKEGENIVVGQS